MADNDDSQLRETSPLYLNDMSKQLQNAGYRPTGNASANEIEVQDQNGQIGRIPTQALLDQAGPSVMQYSRDNGGKAVEPRVALNHPNQPADERDPRLTLTDIAARGLSNTKGFANYLVNKFGKDNVRINDDGEVVTYNPDQLRWNKVDKSIWGAIKTGDLSEMSKDLVEAVPDLAVGAAGSLGGAAGAVGGPATSIAAAAASAGMASRAKQILGQLAGVRDTTAGEDIRDLGVDTLLGGAGQALGAFVKPTINIARTALSKIAAKGPDAVKDAAAILSNTSDLSFDQASRAVTEGERLLPQVKAILQKEGGNPEAALATLENHSIKQARNAIDSGYDALHAAYGQGLKDLVDSTGGLLIKPKALVSDLVTNVRPGMLAQDSYGSLKFANAQQAAAAQGSGLSKVDQDALSPILNRLNGLRFAKESYGEQGTRTLIDTEKELNASVRQLSKSSSVSDTAKAAANELVNGYKKSVSNLFEKAGVGDKYAAMKAPYIAHKDGLDLLDKASDSALLNGITKQGREGVAMSQSLDKLGTISKTSEMFLDNAKDANTAAGLTKVFNPAILGVDGGRNVAKKAIDAALVMKLGNPLALERLSGDVAHASLSKNQGLVKKLVGINPSDALKDPRKASAAVKGLKLLRDSLAKAAASHASGVAFGEDPKALQLSLKRALQLGDEVDHTTAHLINGGGPQQ